jgi:hypothetical protein
MVPTPGCWARDDMGAALAGVFWGVLVGRTLEWGTSMVSAVVVLVVVVFFGSKIVWRRRGSDGETYGADIESIFLLRIGSDILASG